MSVVPRLLVASASGQITVDPHLRMACSRAGRWRSPEPEELVPLPPESELFLLPGRRAVGYDSKTGEFRERAGLAVAAFAAPGYTLSAHPAWVQEKEAPFLPLFAYGAVGHARGRFWICATKVDNDPRQRFKNISPERIARESGNLLRAWPHNRLISHIINNCVRRYDCPAARNFALGRYEAPLPTSRSCNARCLGCISRQEVSSPIQQTPQCRLDFTPDASEIVEVMRIHESREKTCPVYSFGQGCEGDPLAGADLLAESIRFFRQKGGQGTVNCNTNASKPDAVAALAEAGITSIRVSLNSSRPDLYAAYYRPIDYDFAAVRESMRICRRLGVHVSLNLLFFPGVTDTLSELDSLAELCAACGVSLIQLRNLNIDPDWYVNQIRGEKCHEPAPGLRRFMAEMKSRCPWLDFGYFNPFLGTRATISAPMPA